MRLPDPVYRRLVLLNTAVLFLAVLGGTSLLALRGDAILARVGHMLRWEQANSQLIRAITEPAGESLPQWSLRIHPTQLRSMQLMVEEMTRVGAMTDEYKRWFPARFTAEGRSYDVKVRLRGDLPRHWVRAKKSLRVRFPREAHFRGIHELELVIPEDKHYEVEAVAYEMARELGLIAPDAGFAGVQINGIDMGLYFWFERPGKEMLEKLGYPEGEIFALANVWTQTWKTGHGLPSSQYSLHSGSYRARIHEGRELAPYGARWNRFLDLVQDPDDARFAREIEGLLDVEKYLAWNALTWSFGSTHSHWGDNLRWYYDPTHGLFEPLLYDVFPQAIESQGNGSFEGREYDPLARRLLRISAYRERRNAILWRLVNDADFDPADRARERFEELRVGLLRGVNPAHPADLDDASAERQATLRHTREALRGHLAFARLFYEPSWRATGAQDQLALAILPDALAPIRLEAVTFRTRRMAPGVEARWEPQVVLVGPNGAQPLRSRASVRRDDAGALVEVSLDEAVLRTPVDADLAPQASRWELALALPAGEGQDVVELDLRAVNAITGELLPSSHRLGANAPALASPTPTLEPDPLARLAAAGLEAERRGSWLHLPPGRHALLQSVSLPPGYGLELAPGSVLQMAPGTSLLVRGPLRAHGTPEAPVRLQALDATRPFGVLAVVRAGARSELRHVHVSGGSEAWIDGIRVTGQLAFHSSDLTLLDSVVAAAQGDDGLNVKRGDIDFQRCRFEGNTSDGFDGDWVTGRVTESQFARNGGDGIDLSGSRLRVQRSHFEGMGDKALSVGEASSVVVLEGRILDSAIGLAAKDRSEVRVLASVFQGNQVALSVYQKKPIFGGGRALLGSSLLSGNAVDFQVDPESRIELTSVGLDRFESEPRIEAHAVHTGDVLATYGRDGRLGFLSDGKGRVVHDPWGIVRAADLDALPVVASPPPGG